MSVWEWHTDHSKGKGELVLTDCSWWATVLNLLAIGFSQLPLVWPYRVACWLWEAHDRRLKVIARIPMPERLPEAIGAWEIERVFPKRSRRK